MPHNSLLDTTTAELLDEAAVVAGYSPSLAKPILTVLLIEDDPVSARITTAQLRQVGVRVVVAKSAVEALTKFDELLPDAVIVDVNVPRDEDSRPEPLGAEIVASLRDIQSETHPFIIVLTATSSEPMRIQCLQAGADEVYLKTEAPGLLKAKFSRFAQQARSTMAVSDDLNKVAAVAVHLVGATNTQTEILERIEGKLGEMQPIIDDWKERQNRKKVFAWLTDNIRAHWVALSVGTGVIGSAIAWLYEHGFIKPPKG